MCRRISQLASMLAIAFFLGCGDSTPKVKVTAVKGTVTLDGKPMPDGELIFALAGQAPVVMDVKSGVYSGNAPVGNHKVEVRVFKVGPPMSTDPTKAPTKVNSLPDRFNNTSTLKAEVTASGPNEFKFDVTSR